MSVDKLAEYERLIAGATEGPWEVQPYESEWLLILKWDQERRWSFLDSLVERELDAAFMAASRTGWPATIAALRVALEAIDSFHDRDCGSPGQFCFACDKREAALKELEG